MVGEIGQLGEACVESVGASFIDGNGNFEGPIEIWNKPGVGDVVLAVRLTKRFDVSLRMVRILELAELVPLELDAFLRDVDPKAPMAADA